MEAVTHDPIESQESTLDRLIERLIGRQVRGELTDGEFVELRELLARRSRLMRATRPRSSSNSGRFYQVYR